MKKLVVFSGALATLASALAIAGERDARACGGCFHPPPPPTETVSEITAHRMILAVSPQQTTLYDQIQYSGSPSEFAWVLPTNGVVTVGLSSDVLFGTLDALTATQVQAPPDGCPPPPSCGFRNTTVPGVANAGGTDQSSNGGVTVLKQDVVGPYETVQLQSTDPNALDNWLASHGYTIPADVQPIIAEYVQAGSNFLAMKLTPGTGVQSMRPVRVSQPGASATLPLRMVAAGTGAIVGITLWVVADGRYEPSNFPWFHIEDSEITWDWAKQMSDYTSVRAAKEQAANNATWEIESSIMLSTGTVQSYVLNGGVQYGGGASNASADYAAVPANDAGVGGETPEQARQDDLATLFDGIGATNGQARVTRIRSDLSHAALANDLQITASQDQGMLPSLRQAKLESGEPMCTVYDGNCNPAGQVPRSEALNPPKTSTFSCVVSKRALFDDVEVPIVASIAGVSVIGIVLANKRRRRGARK
jgi:hypothetical protein